MRYVLAALLLLAAAAAFTVGCRKDVIVEPPPSLSGDYVGTYSYGVEGQPATVQYITWKFSAEEFLMDLDVTKTPEASRVFCDCGGIYVQGDGIEIRWRTESDKRRKVQTCFPDYGPYGHFTLDQSKPGQVVMESRTPTDDNGFIVRTISLEAAQ